MFILFVLLRILVVYFYSIYTNYISISIIVSVKFNINNNTIEFLVR